LTLTFTHCTVQQHTLMIKFNFIKMTRAASDESTSPFAHASRTRFTRC
jgi:hypothetical protein